MYIHYYNKWMSFTFRNPKPPLRVCFQGVRAITSKESTSKHSMLDFCHVGLSALLARWLVLCFTRWSKSSWNLSSNTTPEARLCHFRNHFAGEKKLGSSPSRSRLMPRQDTGGAAAGEALTASSESGSAALPSSCLTLAQPVYTAGFKLLPQLRQPQSPLSAHVDSDTGSASLPQGNRKNSLLAAEEEVRRAWANKSAAPSVN